MPLAIWYFCLVVYLTTTSTDGKWAVIWPRNFFTNVSFATNFYPGSKYLLPVKKLISNTVVF